MSSKIHALSKVTWEGLLPSRLSKLADSSIYVGHIQGLWKLEAEALEESPVRSIREMVRLQQ